MLRRIGIIGDIHAEDARLEGALGELQRAGVDVIVSVGDVVDGEGDADRCCALLHEQSVVTVRGNHDRWFIADENRGVPDATKHVSSASREFLEALPTTRALETVAGKLLACHGLGADDRAELPRSRRETSAALDELLADRALRFVVSGHTHWRTMRRFAHVLFINAGTLRRTHSAGFLLLDLAASRLELFDFVGEQIVAGTPKALV